MNIHVILRNEDGSSQNPDAPLRKSWNDFHLWFVTGLSLTRALKFKFSFQGHIEFSGFWGELLNIRSSQIIYDLESIKYVTWDG